MNVEPVTEKVLAGITLQLSVEEAKVIKELIGRESRHSVDRLECRPSQEVNENIRKLYHEIGNILA